MTSTQRKAIRKRKERNKKVWWYIQDTLWVLSIFGIVYALLFTPILWVWL